MDGGAEVERLRRDLLQSDSYEFCAQLSDDPLPDVRWEQKHFRVARFFQLWAIYRSADQTERERIRDDVLPDFVCRLNWRTVSRLYDPHDPLFVALFGAYIDNRFAQEYNPRLRARTV